MPKASHRFSLFSQPLDRAALIAYFLGAVLPLAVLAFVLERPELSRAAGGTILRLILVVSLGVLSLGSFLALRRTARAAVARLDADNRRLATLLEASRALASAVDHAETSQLSANYAVGLAGCEAGLFFVRRGNGNGDGVEAAATTGAPAEEALSRHRATLTALAEQAISTGRLAIAEPHEVPAVAVPCGDRGARPGALVVVAGAPLPETDLQSLSALAGIASVTLNNVELREAQSNFFTHATHLLVGALDSYLDTEADHSSRVAHVAVQMGRELGFTDDQLERLHFAALLHDIGMLRIDHALLGDRQAWRQHPRLGCDMLQSIRLWEDLAPVVLAHQEWYDGGGYPAGISGEEIPLDARIIGLAEAFDGMTNPAGYKPAVGVEEALRRIEEGAGGQFDPDLVRLFVELARRGAFDERLGLVEAAVTA